MLDLLKEIVKCRKNYGIPMLVRAAKLMQYPYYIENHWSGID